MSVRPQTKDKPAAASFEWDDPFLPRRPAHRRRADGPRHGARLCAGASCCRASSRPICEERFDREIMNEMGELGLLGVDPAGGIWRRRRRLCRLRPDRARGRARRFSGYRSAMSRAVLARHVSDLCLRLRGAAQEIPAEARDRRMGRLLRPDRARRRLRSRRHDDPRREDRRRLPAHRRQDVDHQFADRRRLRRLGEVRRA